jgi:CubicO group peptidase (beta-lactamase class C family)
LAATVVSGVENVDFSQLHAAMRRWVDADLLAGVSCAVIVGRDLVDVHCEGYADREARVALGEDHIFRVFSNTKLVTSCAVLRLVERGQLGLDDPVDRWLPALAQRQVLRPGATAIDDTVPAVRPMTVRHLLTHSSGLAYGLLDPGTLMYRAYHARRILSHETTLDEMVEQLAGLPLKFQPGEGWEYSIATDVLARLVEVVAGERFDTFIAREILQPLGMNDTGFVVPEGQRQRLVAYYAGVNRLDPRVPGLVRTDQAPYPGAYLHPVPRLSGGGGLVSTLRDMVSLVRALMPSASGSSGLLREDTLAQMMRNQLPEAVTIGFPGLGRTPGKGFGLGGAVVLSPTSLEPAAATGEFQWGGIAGTHWWISPAHDMAGVIMAQRQMGFWNPFFFDLKAHVYAAIGAR